MPGDGKRMPGEGKMFATAGALSLAGGGEFLAASDRAEPLLIAVCRGTSSALGREAFLMADDVERLAVGVGSGTSSDPVGGEARMTGGGYTGTSGAGEPFAVGLGDKARAVAGLPHDRLRSPQRHVATVPWSVTDGGGAIESGGPTELWQRAAPYSQKLTNEKLTASNPALFNRILQSASLLLPEDYSAREQHAVPLSPQ